ncbi:MAG: DUF2281 domain-containing protein [Candidatus Caenarcaniphilales bacterium]|nr:DUF2281 domain-containing protein [Candidatus Caenarcaniphilales bacterium]
MGLKEKLISSFDKLPPEKQEEVIDFVEYLNNKQDATDYLFGSKANKKQLLETIEEVEENKNLITVDFEEIKKGNFPSL